MAIAKSFGRRNIGMQRPSPEPAAKPMLARAPEPEISPQPPAPLPPAPESPPLPHTPSVEDELHEWKKSRRFTIPWRQISLIASLCFAIASFVLPDSVSGVADVVLYGLSAMSFYVWWQGRTKKTATR